jgi:hypothetical protein
MRATTRLLSVLAATGLVAGSLHAQTCSGRPYFSTGPIQVDGGVALGKSMRSYGAAFEVGVDRGAFGGLGLAHMTEDNGLALNSPSGSSLTGSIGYQLNVKTNARIQVCPVASFERRSLDYGSTTQPVTVRRTELAAGGTVGFVLPSNRGVHLVPFAGIRYAERRGSFAVGTNRSDLADVSYTPGVFGLGLHVRDKYMFTGHVMVPFGMNDADPVYGLSLVLPLGRITK